MTTEELTESILAAGDINREASVTFDEVVKAIAKAADALVGISITLGTIAANAADTIEQRLNEAAGK